MSNNLTHNEATPEASKARGVDLKLEVSVLPVSDVDRAKRFYEELGWRLDADFVRNDGSRAVQLTPPGSMAARRAVSRARIRSGAATARSQRSPIPTATPGSSRK